MRTIGSENTEESQNIGADEHCGYHDEPTVQRHLPAPAALTPVDRRQWWWRNTGAVLSGLMMG
ncbi:MAG: hypothetical protein WDM77_14755 [Steroidobacteraceae bacterium]